MFSAAASLTRRPPHPSAAISARRPSSTTRRRLGAIEVDRGRGRDPEPRRDLAPGQLVVVAQLAHEPPPLRRVRVTALARARRGDQRLELVGLEDRALAPPHLQPRDARGRVVRQPASAHGRLEHARQQHEELVDRRVRQRPQHATVEVTQLLAGLDRGDDHRPLVELVLHERLDDLVGDLVDPVRPEKRQKVATQPPQVVGAGVLGEPFGDAPLQPQRGVLVKRRNLGGLRRTCAAASRCPRGSARTRWPARSPRARRSILRARCRG